MFNKTYKLLSVQWRVVNANNHFSPFEMKGPRSLKWNN